MFLTSRLGRYLFRETLAGYGVTLSVIVIAIALVDVVEQMRSIGRRVDLSMLNAAGLTALKMPSLIDETFPFIVLVGTMIAFIRMNRRGELAALRAAGVSAWRFTSPAFALAAGLGLLAALVLNPLAVRLSGEYEARKADIKRGQITDASTTGDRVWLRQGEKNGQTIVTGLPPTDRSPTLVGVTFFVFERVGPKEMQFSRRIDAAKAALAPGKWELDNAVENVPGISQNSYSHLSMPTRLDASTLLGRFASPEAVSFWRLPGVIQGLRDAGFSPHRYDYRFHRLLARPFFFAAMAAIAAALCLGLARGGGLVARGAVAVGVGILVYFFTSLAGAFAFAEAASPALAAWSPPMAALACGLAALSFREDG
jgi:lipopolysaccharide export system permease protein